MIHIVTGLVVGVLIVDDNANSTRDDWKAHQPIVSSPKKPKRGGISNMLWRAFHADESGQGLVEYLLIVALVALAATAGMSSAASYINSAFIRVGGKLGTYIS